jgi:arylsulfatase A-like enzyme
VFDNIYAHASFSYASVPADQLLRLPGLPWHYALLEDARPIPKTLASAMRDRGARTGYFMAGDLEWGDQRWLLGRKGGFDLLQGAPDMGCPLLSSWGTEDRCLVDRLLGWIAEKPEQPFFAIAWTDQTHDPFVLSPGVTAIETFRGNTPAPFAADLSRYLSLVHNADAQLARLFAALRERGIADDTLVVVTGDHGEAFADPHPQRGHAWSVYDEEVRVPLLLWNPRLFPEGRRVPTLGGHVDLNPTLADILDVPPDGEWQGHSLFDPAHPERAYFMAIAGGDIFGVREGDWKYIYDVTSGRESLFNLRLDPEEQHDFARGEPEHAARLRQRVAAWVTFEDAFLWGREN